MREKQNRRKIGATYEQAVGFYLTQHGYVVLEYNYRCRFGEIDLIAWDEKTLVFCEVKYRRNGSRGGPLEAVGTKKQRTIYQCAQCYVLRHHLENLPCRFDVIGIEGSEITLIKNAFVCEW